MKSALLLAVAVQDTANVQHTPAQGQQQSPLGHHNHPSFFQCFQLRHLLLCATPLSGETPLRTLVCGQCQEDCLCPGFPCSPQYSCIRYLFNSTGKRVPQTHIKVLSKQSLASYRDLLPTTTESGTTTPCPLATHTDSRSVCKVIQGEIKHFFWH